jgi:plasmid stabilization system protein ParE
VIRIVIVLPRAERDLEKASQWYEKREPGLGYRLLIAADDAIRILKEDADRHHPYYRDLRRIALSTFPYKYFYKIEENRVFIFRFLHDKRDHPRHLRR